MGIKVAILYQIFLYLVFLPRPSTPTKRPIVPTAYVFSTYLKHEISPWMKLDDLHSINSSFIVCSAALSVLPRSLDRYRDWCDLNLYLL